MAESIFVVALLATTLFQIITPSSACLPFGASCTSADCCDPSAYLTCSHGKCDCFMDTSPASMNYSMKLSKCVVLAGAKCVYHGKSWGFVERMLVPCVENARCEKHGKCECSAGFRAFEGACVPTKSFGQPCTRIGGGDDCENNLTCGDNSTCECKDKMYNQTSRWCFQTTFAPGEQCDDTKNCTQHAKCVSTTSGGNSVCACDMGYISNSNLCVPCPDDREIVCDGSGKCDCEDAKSRKRTVIDDPVDFESRYWIESAPDEEDTWKLTSLENHNSSRHGVYAVCYGGLDSGYTCTCAPGYYSDYDNPGTCVPKRVLGERCQGWLMCDPRRYLVCGQDNPRLSEERCACPEAHTYDETQGRCLLAVGSRCGVWRRPEDVGKSVCVSNAQCEPSSKLCECDYTHVAASNGTCVPKGWHGHVCLNDGDCGSGLLCKNRTCGCGEGVFDQIRRVCVTEGGNCRELQHSSELDECPKELACENGACTCPLNLDQVFEPRLHKCLSLVGRPCNLSDEGRTCWDRSAHCVANKGNGASCRCLPGYVEVGQTCELVFGSKCGGQGKDQYPKCNSLVPLVCHGGKCDCPGKLEVYHEVEGRCKGEVGAVCDPDQKGYCGEGSECKEFRVVSQKETTRMGECVQSTGTVH